MMLSCKKTEKKNKNKRNLGGDLFVIVLDIVEGKKARGH